MTFGNNKKEIVPNEEIECNLFLETYVIELNFLA